MAIPREIRLITTQVGKLPPAPPIYPKKPVHLRQVISMGSLPQPITAAALEIIHRSPHLESELSRRLVRASVSDLLTSGIELTLTLSKLAVKLSAATGTTPSHDEVSKTAVLKSYLTSTIIINIMVTVVGMTVCSPTHLSCLTPPPVP